MSIMKIIDFFTNFKEKINLKKKVIKDDTIQEKGERKT